MTGEAPQRPHLAFRPLIPTCTLLLALAVVWVRVSGCGGERPGPLEDTSVESLALRDVLGFEQRHLAGLATSEREALAERAVEAALTDDGAVLDDPTAASRALGQDPTFPEDPLGAVARMDEALALADAPPRLFGVYHQDADGAHGIACAPEIGDLLDARGWPAAVTPQADDGARWPGGWRVAPSWVDAQPEALPALRALAPALSAWTARCARQHGLTLPEQTQVFQQSPQAPFLLAWWPQRHKLYIHPLLLTLWTRPLAATRTAAPALTLNTTDLNQCLAELTTFCQQCDTQDEATRNPECEDFFPNSTVFEDCRTMTTSLAQGLALYCVHEIFQSRPAVETCVSTDTAGVCNRRNIPVSSVDTLSQAYQVFGAQATAERCQEAVNQCADPNNRPGNNALPDPGNVNDGEGGGGDDKEEPGCADNLGLDACNEWCSSQCDGSANSKN